MIKNIFTCDSVVARLETGPLGSHLDEPATTLQNQRYAASTIGIYLREAHAFGRWANERYRLGQSQGRGVSLSGYVLTMHSK